MSTLEANKLNEFNMVVGQEVIDLPFHSTQAQNVLEITKILSSLGNLENSNKLKIGVKRLANTTNQNKNN